MFALYTSWSLRRRRCLMWWLVVGSCFLSFFFPSTPLSPSPQKPKLQISIDCFGGKVAATYSLFVFFQCFQRRRRERKILNNIQNNLITLWKITKSIKVLLNYNFGENRKFTSKFSTLIVWKLSILITESPGPQGHGQVHIVTLTLRNGAKAKTRLQVSVKSHSQSSFLVLPS